MRIDSIEIYQVSMPMKSFYKTSFAKTFSIDGVLVKLTSGDRYGWGEAAAWKEPTYCPECSATQFLIGRDFLAPLVKGKEVASGEELQELFAHIRGNYFAKAPFDLAWWDLYAKIQEKPLWQLIGGQGPIIDGGAAYSAVEDVDKLLDLIAGAVENGYKRIKLKYCPGWDLPVIKTVREKFPDPVIHIDCNSAYTLDDLDMFKELDNYNLAMIEQPLQEDDLLDHAKLREQIKTPICLDESIISVEKARKAIELKSCQWVNIKLSRVGGLTNMMKINETCQKAGIPCWIGSMGESAVGASFKIAAATLPNIKYPSDILPSNRFYEEDLSTPPLVHCAPSQFKANDSPGTGTEPRPDLLEKCTVAKVIIK